MSDENSPGIKLFLLGSPRVECNGRPVTLETRKAVALLAYLALTRQAHHRDTLAALLWPDQDQTRARGALRTTLSVLYKALGKSGLEITRETISLDPSTRFWLDVTQFRALMAQCRTHGHGSDEVCPECKPLFRSAVDLYRDDFMAGFSLRDSSNFDDWQFFQADSLHQELAHALEKLALYFAASGELDDGISYTRRWLALDPLHEEAHRQLMRLYEWSGQHHAALQQYRECERVLRQELGVSPLDETNQLYQAIQQHQPIPRPVATAQVKKTQKFPIPGHFPLIGRSKETAELLETYQKKGQDGFFLALEGEAGIGKTRLADEFLTAVRAMGAFSIEARCYEGEADLAYGPIIAGLRKVLESPEGISRLKSSSLQWLSESERLIPELAQAFPNLPPAPTLEGPGARSRFFEGLRHLLMAVSASALPGILYLDDLHWADPATLDLIHYIVRRMRGSGLFILATWRNEGLPANERLDQMMQEAKGSGWGTSLALGRLYPFQIAELVRSRVSTPVPEILKERLYRESEGLPFFIVEYLENLPQDLPKTNPNSWAMPANVRELLRLRLAAASEPGRQLLTGAAVIGRSFDFDTLREVSGRSEAEIVAGLEELIARRLITEHKSSQESPEKQTFLTSALVYDFCHEKLRQVEYEQTSLARRRLLHRRAAEALVGQARSLRNRGTVESQIANHYQLAGQDALAAQYYQLAGEFARTIYANQTAVAHFQAALALGHPDAADLHEAIGDMQTLQGDYPAALSSYETAVTLCKLDCIAAIEHKLGNVYYRRGAWKLAESHFQQAHNRLGENGSPTELARLFADWSRTDYHQDQLEQAAQLAHKALELAVIAQDDLALAQTQNLLGILARSRMDYEQAAVHLRISLEIAARLGDLAPRIAALNNLALVCMDQGDLKQAINLTQNALELCIQVGDHHREAALHNNLADLFHSIGQEEQAMIHLKIAVSIFAEIGGGMSEEQQEIWKLIEW
jgi:predicted ATPase/DNA-binding SARP family transcriptional activator